MGGLDEGRLDNSDLPAESLAEESFPSSKKNSSPSLRRLKSSGRIKLRYESATLAPVAAGLIVSQKFTLNPNCISRGSPADDGFPNWLLLLLPEGALKFTLLVRLKASAKTCTLNREVRLTNLENLASKE